MSWQKRNVPSLGFNVIPFDQCIAKTYLAPDGTVNAGRTVLNHCQIVGEIAREIIARVPTTMAKLLFPKGAPLAAAAHDIGKVSPYFAEKIRRPCQKGVSALSAYTHINPETEKEWGGHAGVSQVTAKALNAPSYVPEILGQHHGFSPSVSGKRAYDEVFGGVEWQSEREALVSELKQWLAMDWPQVESMPQARLLAGLTSVADWIGSGTFFENPHTAWQENIGRALDEAGFVAPSYRMGLEFSHIFDFEPRAIQQALIEQVTAPGVYVLEAPMGLGKTEAALYAAYRVLEQGKATGIYFALPTQLTSNKIYERFQTFLKNILGEDCQHRSLLLHSHAHLVDTEMGEEGRPGGAWFNQAKRGLLAPFAVGTIDQALMAAMNVKHGFVRAFGLAGKVVILDEVHTYDAYTGTLLDALVELLRALHCTVIILSATLNQERRRQLLACPVHSDAYPLITAKSNDSPQIEIEVSPQSSQEVAICLVTQDSEAIKEALNRAAQGQQVLWVENTVQEAQQRYLDMAARASELGVTCGLLHSRFTVDDRQRLEDGWVNVFGKAGWSQRGKQGRILVGTQVLEQSLDIDADFLVSRFAPTDMLLQRIGRLWRHHDTPRAHTATCEAWLLAPALEKAREHPVKAFGATALVYSSYVLCRSLEVWQELTALVLPHDIRPLIERTYVGRLEEGVMARWLHELDEGTPRRVGRKALHQLARVTLAEVSNTMPENKAQTRFSENDSVEVLLLRKLEVLSEQKVSRLTLINGEQILLPWQRHRLSKRAWRQLSVQLMRQIVLVRAQDAPLPVSLDTLEKIGLQHCFYLGSPAQDEALLRVVLLENTGRLHGVYGASTHQKHILEYRDDLGYRVIKI